MAEVQNPVVIVDHINQRRSNGSQQIHSVRARHQDEVSDDMQIQILYDSRIPSSSSAKMSHSEKMCFVCNCDPCSPDCQLTDFSGPFRVQMNQEFGRFLVATRDIDPGEVLIQERPLLIGPSGQSSSLRVCLGCYASASPCGPTYKCSKCGWPVCSPQCEMMPDHALLECRVFADCPVSPVTCPSEYEKILVLRALLLQDQSPDKWRRLFRLESHVENRKQNYESVTNLISLYKFIRQECHLPFEHKLVHHLAGICAINSFGNGVLGSGTWPRPFRNASVICYKASFLLHDCTPNTRCAVRENGRSFSLTILASRKIQTGEILTTAYTDTSRGTLERRAILKSSYFFSCKCLRCQDPTELGTFLSALCCPECKSGPVLPSHSLEYTSTWVCGHCSYEMKTSEVAKIAENVRILMMTRGKTVAELEQCLQKGLNLLHPHHFLIVDIQCQLIEMIGKELSKMERIAIRPLSETSFKRASSNTRIQLVRRAVELCRNCLSVADAIRPGSNSCRGNLLYHLQKNLTWLSIYKMEQCKDTTSRELVRKTKKKNLAEILEIRKEACEILSVEPRSSVEWQMAKELSTDSSRIKALMAFFNFKS